MPAANYGYKVDCDTKEDMLEVLMKDKGPLELCGIINRILDQLYHKKEVKVIDGMYPEDNFLSEITYDQESDNVYYWTENV